MYSYGILLSYINMNNEMRLEKTEILHKEKIMETLSSIRLLDVSFNTIIHEKKKNFQNSGEF